VPDEPEFGVIYCAHPFLEATYVKMAEYHYQLIRDKEAQFMRLVASLGAKGIVLLKDEGATQEGETYIQGVGLRSLLDTGISIKGNRHEGDMLNMSARFDSPPVHMPAVPEGITWLRQEPLWQVMVESRLKYWCTSYNVSFEYRRGLGVGANIDLTVKGIGMGGGVNFGSEETIRQMYRVDFWPREFYGDV
jgi:hypothetical protein